MQELTRYQNEILKELIDESLSKAAKSLEQMLKIRIREQLIDFGQGYLPAIPELDLLGRFKVHLVKVVFKGEIRGAFYFIINGHELDLISRVALPKYFSQSKPSEIKQMAHGFMAEIENMIAAQTLAEMGDYLGVQVLGEVPEVNMSIPGEEINNYLRNQNLENNTAYHVVSVLGSVAGNFSPYFLWMIDKEFIEKLRLNVVS